MKINNLFVTKVFILTVSLGLVAACAKYGSDKKGNNQSGLTAPQAAAIASTSFKGSSGTSYPPEHCWALDHDLDIMGNDGVSAEEICGLDQIADRRLNPDSTVGGYVSRTAHVDETATVGFYAMVCDEAQVLGQAKILDQASVFDSAVVQDKAMIYGCAQIMGDSTVVSGEVFDDSKILNSVIPAGVKVHGLDTQVKNVKDLSAGQDVTSDISE